MRERANEIRAVFVIEPDAGELLANLVARGKDGWRDDLGWYARRSVRHGEWLRREAEKRSLAVVPARPRETLADRILAAAALDRARGDVARREEDGLS
jgi:hypothetical protein